MIKIDLRQLAELVRAQPDATLRELRDRLQVECSEPSICRALARLNLTFKKRQSMLPSKTDRTLPNNVANGRSTGDGMSPD